MAVDFVIICAALAVAAVLVNRVGGGSDPGRKASTPEVLRALLGVSGAGNKNFAIWLSSLWMWSRKSFQFRREGVHRRLLCALTQRG